MHQIRDTKIKELRKFKEQICVTNQCVYTFVLYSSTTLYFWIYYHLQMC